MVVLSPLPTQILSRHKSRPVSVSSFVRRAIDALTLGLSLIHPQINLTEFYSPWAFYSPARHLLTCLYGLFCFRFCSGASYCDKKWWLFVEGEKLEKYFLNHKDLLKTTLFSMSMWNQNTVSFVNRHSLSCEWCISASIRFISYTSKKIKIE